MRVMRFRKSKEIGSSRVAATVAIDPADLLERGRAAATEVIEAALAAGHIETLRPTRKRHPGRKAALWIALGVTALTAAYIWWQRRDGA